MTPEGKAARGPADDAAFRPSKKEAAVGPAAALKRWSAPMVILASGVDQTKNGPPGAPSDSVSSLDS
jgi:hypothetical protein